MAIFLGYTTESLKDSGFTAIFNGLKQSCCNATSISYVTKQNKDT